MKTVSLVQLLRGPFNFLQLSEEELHSLFPGGSKTLPVPHPIYLNDETSSSLYGFPVLLSDGLGELREALRQYIAAEEEAQMCALRREPFARTTWSAAWERYRNLLVRAVEYSTVSSYGRHYPALFWLHHSADVARRLKESPKRVLRFDLEMGRRYGEHIKYRVFEKLADQVRAATYETVHGLAPDVVEVERELFPRVLVRMFDNVLIFTEDHISFDLAELSSYLNGFLRINARTFRQRFAKLLEWHAAQIATEADLRAITTHLLKVDPDGDPLDLIRRPGYVSFLATRRDYDRERLLAPEQVQLWEELLVKLKEFELLNALRSLMLPVRHDGEHLVFRAGGLDRTWVGQRHLHLSPATRPLDFLSPSVIDPMVHRFGLIYDMSQFSQVVSVLRRSGSDMQEHAFRRIFQFQRRVNRLAGIYRLQLEKYLGDGAFYTSRQPLPVLLCAIHLQRLYQRAIREGLPFDRGLRIGLNFGHYRLLPIQGGSEGEPERYEFFGHGVVELSRLTSGKGVQDLEETKNVLINQGYPREAVLRFFEPLTERHLDVVDQEEQERPHYAYINRNGTLINEGIVATGEIIAQLDESLPHALFYSGRLGRHAYVVLPLDDSGDRLYVGVRRMGVARLKGLDELPVFEIIDGAEVDDATLEELEADSLASALEWLAAVRIASKGA